MENSRRGVSIFKVINLEKFNQITLKIFFSKIHYPMEIQGQCQGHLQKSVNKFQFCLLFIENVYYFFLILLSLRKHLRVTGQQRKMKVFF